ncbi:hypothetical protein WDW86_10280 [Bdellovibrionota bacterium FG-2]
MKITTFILVAVATVEMLMGSGCATAPKKPQLLSTYEGFFFTLAPVDPNALLKTNRIRVFKGLPCQSSDPSQRGTLLCDPSKEVLDGLVIFTCAPKGEEEPWRADLALTKGDLPPAFLGLATSKCIKDADRVDLHVWYKGPESENRVTPLFPIGGDWTPQSGGGYWTPESERSHLIFEVSKEKRDIYAREYDLFYKKNIEPIKQAEALAMKKEIETMGYPLTESVFRSCYDAQITAARSRTSMGTQWIPAAATLFRADDNFYKVIAMISQNPIQLLIEGPAQFVEGLQNQCLAVLTIRNPSQLAVSRLPTPGYKIQLDDMIHGFRVRSLGKIEVRLKGLRDITHTSVALPNLELISDIPMAQSQ